MKAARVHAFGEVLPLSRAGWPSCRSLVSQYTLAFSLLTGVRAMTQVFPLQRAAEAYDLMASGEARFRAVLTLAR